MNVAIAQYIMGLLSSHAILVPEILITNCSLHRLNSKQTKTNVSSNLNYALVHALLLYGTITWRGTYSACMQKFKFFTKSRDKRHC